MVCDTELIQINPYLHLHPPSQVSALQSSLFSHPPSGLSSPSGHPRLEWVLRHQKGGWIRHRNDPLLHKIISFRSHRTHQIELNIPS
jgi:hypothetical protein